MRYETIKALKEEDFRRLTGVKRKTFNEMALLLSAAKAKQKARGGKPNGLVIEDLRSLLLACPV